MRCIIADDDACFQHWLKRSFRYTPASAQQYVVMLPMHAERVLRGVPSKCVSCLVVPTQSDAKLRLEAQVVGAHPQFKLFCPDAGHHNTRQLVKAVVRYAQQHVEALDFLVLPRMGPGDASTAYKMHAGFVDAL